jgi:nitric oxide reductase subunit B
MKYQSQQVALLYFRGALLIFSLQILFGLIGATIYVAPTLIPVGLLPFSVVRMIHTNALIIWLLMGFFGSTYFLLPEETEREIYSPLLAKVQFWIFLTAAVVAVLGYLVGNYDGRSYLEQPIYIKVGIFIGQRRHRQDVLVVGRASLGRGRMGTGDGVHPRLPADQADRHRP